MFAAPVKKNKDTNVCHSRESGAPLFKLLTSSWIPAFAGMTTNYECIMLINIIYLRCSVLATFLAMLISVNPRQKMETG